MKVTDPDVEDILFLDRHPGWSYQDLQATPFDIVESLKLLDNERHKRP